MKGAFVAVAEYLALILQKEGNRKMTIVYIGRRSKHGGSMLCDGSHFINRNYKGVVRL